MKRFVLIMLSIFTCAIACAEQITINWLNEDKTTNQTTSCTIGGDVILPYTPTKYGYTFQGWIANCTPIEYLESTGTQWIDTGVYPNQDTRVQTKFQLKSISGIDSVWFGAGDGKYNRFASYAWSGKMYIDIGNSSRMPTSLQVDDVLEMYMSQNSTTYSVNGVYKTPVTFQYENFTSSNPMYVFNASIGTYTTRMKLYYFKMYDNDTLVRDFIPVLDKDGTPCMYDKVEGKFYYNAGTDQFIAGPKINE